MSGLRRNGFRDQPERFTSNEIVKQGGGQPYPTLNLSPWRLQLLAHSNLAMKAIFASNSMLDLTGPFLRRVMGGWIMQAAVMMDEVFTRRNVLRPADIKGFGELGVLKQFLKGVITVLRNLWFTFLMLKISR